MKVTLKRQNNAIHFQGENSKGLTVDIDGSERVGGKGKGVSPMEMVLMATAGCSSIDIHVILKKMRQEIEDLQVHVEGERVDAVPAVFKTITMHYAFKGDLKPEKVQKAVNMSLDKYCSVSKMLEHSVKIKHKISINGEVLA